MEVTRKLLAVYTRFGVEALIEAPGVKTDKDIAILRDIMRSYSVPAGTYQVPMSNAEKSNKASTESQENSKTVAAVMSEIPVHDDPAPKRVRVARLGRSTRVGANLG